MNWLNFQKKKVLNFERENKNGIDKKQKRSQHTKFDTNNSNKT